MSKYAGRATHCIAEGCGVELCHPRKRKSDYCRRCAAQSPERRARLSEVIKIKHQDPEYRAKLNPRAVMLRTLEARPELREFYRENMRRLGQEHGGTVAGSDKSIRAHRASVATRMRDVPLEYRGEFRTLMLSQKVLRPDRVRMIHEQMKFDQSRFNQTGELQATKGTKR